MLTGTTYPLPTFVVSASYPYLTFPIMLEIIIFVVVIMTNIH